MCPCRDRYSFIELRLERRSGSPAHFRRSLRVVSKAGYMLRQGPPFRGRDSNPAIGSAQTRRDLTIVVPDKDRGPACGQNPIKLARNNEPLKLRPQRDKVHVGHRKTFREPFRGLIGLEMHVLELAACDFLMQSRVVCTATNEQEGDGLPRSVEILAGNIGHGCKESIQFMHTTEITRITDHKFFV